MRRTYTANTCKKQARSPSATRDRWTQKPPEGAQRSAACVFLCCPGEYFAISVLDSPNQAGVYSFRDSSSYRNPRNTNKINLAVLFRQRGTPTASLTKNVSDAVTKNVTFDPSGPFRQPPQYRQPPARPCNRPDRKEKKIPARAGTVPAKSFCQHDRNRFARERFPMSTME